MSTSPFSRIRSFTSKDLQLKLKELFDKFVQNAVKDNPDLVAADLRSIGKMSRHIVKLDSERLAFATTIDKTKQYYYPLEGPGYDHLMVWFALDHLGTHVRDISGHEHHGKLLGHPTLNRLPIDHGYLQTPAAPGFPGMAFNIGGDSVNAVEGEAIQVPDHPDLQIANKSNGFSFAFNFISLDYSLHTGPGFQFNRRFVNKRDDSLHAYAICFGTGGDVEVTIFDDGIEYNMDLEALSTNVFYRVVITYNPSGGPLSANRIKCYKNGVDASSDTTPGLLIPPDLPNTDMYIASRDVGLGWFRGYISDFRMYDFVLSPTQVSNLATNYVTILNIPKGQVAMVNQYVLS